MKGIRNKGESIEENAEPVFARNQGATNEENINLASEIMTILNT